jgi:sodium-coupled neutral amino acid transporter 10
MGDVRLLMTLSLFAVLPVSLLPRLERLGSISLASLLPLIFLLGVQLATLARDGVAEAPALAASQPLLALPIIVFAFASQQALFPIFNELRARDIPPRHSEAAVQRIVAWSLALTAAVYLACGLLSYLAVGARVESNLLSSLPASATTTALSAVFGVGVLLSYPVILFPCRISLDRLLFPSAPSHTRPRFVAETLGVLAVVLAIALAIPDLGAVLGLFGSLSSTCIGFVLPSLFFLSSSDRLASRRALAWLLLVGGAASGSASFVLVTRDFSRRS